MIFPRILLCLICLIFCAFTFTFAQNVSPTASQTEKEKAQKELEKRALQMIDQAVGDAAFLKVAQNRATVYALAGDLYWKFDEKRARELFRNSASEIITANAEDETDKKNDDDPYFAVFRFSGGIRNEILPLVAKHDADLALELLVQTRPAKLAAALAKSLQPNAKQSDRYMNFDPEQNRVRSEIALEQQFAVLAAEQNPDKAIKLMKESLAKGISWNVLPLLRKINAKDEKKAAQLADDLIGKISDTDLTKKIEDLNAAVMLLQYATNPNAPKNTKEKQFKFSDDQLKTLGGKIADTFLQSSNSLNTTMMLSRIMPSLEKIVPEKIPALKQKQSAVFKNLPPEMQEMQKQQKLWDPNSTPEEILAQVPKLTNEFQKVTAYESLSNKISQIEDESRAKTLIEQIPDEKARQKANEKYESARIDRTAKAGKLDEARKLIGNLNKKATQIQKLVSLATEFQKKGTEEDRATAAALMKDAKSLANQYPEDEDELNDLMEVVRGYAVVEPNEAFQIFEPIVDQINDYVQASAILSKYNKRDQTFKKGELLLRVNGSSSRGLLLFRYIGQIQLLGKADLNRTNTLADKFQRTDARTIVKLFIAQGFLKEDKKDDKNNQSEGTTYYFESE